MQGSIIQIFFFCSSSCWLFNFIAVIASIRIFYQCTQYQYRLIISKGFFNCFSFFICVSNCWCVFVFVFLIVLALLVGIWFVQKKYSSFNFLRDDYTSPFIINESEHIFHTFIDCNSGNGEVHRTQMNINNNLDFRGTLFDNRNDFDINSLRTILDFFFLVCVNVKTKKKKKTVESTVAIKPMMNSSYCTIFSILYMLSCYVRSKKKRKKIFFLRAWVWLSVRARRVCLCG